MKQENKYNEADPFIENVKTVEKIAQEAADKAADKALERMLLRLGIDAEDSKSWRNDFYFLARMSRGVNQISNAAVKTCVGAAILGIIWIVMQGFKDWIFLPGVK